MIIKFNHYSKGGLDNIINMLPTDQDCVYYDMCKILHLEPSLGKFVQEDDTILTEKGGDDYDDNVVVLYKRHGDEPRALFCFDPSKGLNGKQFYCALVDRILTKYAEEFI